MNNKLLVVLGTGFGVISLLISGCAGTPKKSKWASPKNVTIEKVFNAALIAATENKFTIANKDRSAGVISLRKEEYGGTERRMSVKLEQVGNKVIVSSKVSGSDVGIVEGTLGGAVNQELTNNFYFYLFRELNITDPSLQNVVIEDTH